MSGGSAKKEMETDTSRGKAPSMESGAQGREDSPPRVKSHLSGDKMKKMKKVVYYETDSSSPSTSGSHAPSVTSRRHECKKFSKIPLCYPRISKCTPLLSVPLGKPPVFDGEDYCMWSDKMMHLLGAFVFRRSSKTWLTMFPKCNICTGTFGLGIKLYTIWKAWSGRRLNQFRSYAQGSIGSTAEKGTDLKGKRLSSPRWIVIMSIVNIKGMNVSLHRLRPVPINRWTVPPYCSRWLVFVRASRLDFYLLSSRRYKCNSIWFFFIHDDIIKPYWWCYMIIRLLGAFVLQRSSKMWFNNIFQVTCKQVPSDSGQKHI
jgi:hypothetical protein